MRSLLVLCAVLYASYALKCYKDASKGEGHTETKKEIECVCGDYCVKYFAEGKGKEIAKDKQIKHENGQGINDEGEEEKENEKLKEKTVVEKTKTEKTTTARAASWDCGCSRTGGFQSDMCKEEGRGVFGENPQLEVTCCKGDLCNGALSKFSLFASLISLCAFYLWKH